VCYCVVHDFCWDLYNSVKKPGITSRLIQLILTMATTSTSLAVRETILGVLKGRDVDGTGIVIKLVGI
jgi:hypothetical protein